MTLREYTAGLPKSKQYDLAIKLIKLALPIWSNYVEKNELVYRDTVVGMMHEIDRDLLPDSVLAAEEYLAPKQMETNTSEKNILIHLLERFRLKQKMPPNKLIHLYDKFLEPIVALQDLDWELPYETQRIFYAVYNLLSSLVDKEETIFNEPTIYVSINQAIDALETSQTLSTDEVKKVIYERNASSDTGASL